MWEFGELLTLSVMDGWTLTELAEDVLQHLVVHVFSQVFNVDMGEKWGLGGVSLAFLMDLTVFSEPVTQQRCCLHLTEPL